MSYVTGVVMQCSVVEESAERDGPMDEDEWDYPLLDAIDRWIEDRGFRALHRVGRAASRGKHPQIEILCGGYNYFPADEFRAFVLSLPWRSPHQMVLLLTTEDEPTRLSTARDDTDTDLGEK